MSQDKTHAKYSPSSAFRWTNCPGSIRLTLNIPRTDNKYSLEGTLGHTVFECAVTGESFKKRTKGQIVPLEMINHASESWELIKRETMVDLGMFDEILVEQKVVMDHIHENFSGTVDLALVAYGDELWVIDYKYGAGYAVDVKDNEQLISYASGLLRKFKNHSFKRVVIAVSQPRAYHEDGVFRSQSFEVNEIKQWEAKFKKAIQECEKPDAPTNPGEWCRWCPALTFCPSVSTKALKQAQADFSPVTSETKLPDPTTIKDLGLALSAFTHIRKWMTAIEELAFERAESGKPITGWKLVQKRGTRQWIDEAKVEKEAKKLFKDSAFSKPELLSPAQLEKVAGKDWVNKFAAMKSTGTTLVPQDDSRDETTSAKLDFAEKDNNDKKEKKKNGK